MANRTVRTNIEMDRGLKSFVADMIMARHNNNRKLARELKLTIDKIIKDKDLDSDMVYFYYGDPDDPSIDYKTVEERIKHHVVK